MTEREMSRPYFESIHGDIYLWRIGEITAEQALEGIDKWMSSVEAGFRRSERPVKCDIGVTYDEKEAP